MARHPEALVRLKACKPCLPGGGLVRLVWKLYDYLNTIRKIPSLHRSSHKSGNFLNLGSSFSIVL
jgi:hypothetical protein